VQGRLGALVVVAVFAATARADDRADFDKHASVVESPNGAFAFVIPGDASNDEHDAASDRWSFGNGVAHARLVAEELFLTEAPTRAETIARLQAFAKPLIWEIDRRSPDVIAGRIRSAHTSAWTPIYLGFAISADHTIQRLTVSVDDIGMRSPGLWSGIATKILASATPRHHRLALGTRRIEILPDLELAVPAQWAWHVEGTLAMATDGIPLVLQLVSEIGGPTASCRIVLDPDHQPPTVTIGRHQLAISCVGATPELADTARDIASKIRASP
jgi:hypothetical protein